MRPAPRVLVPLKSMCSKMWESPAPSHCPSWTLPARHHACAETTGALRSSRTIIVKPLGKEASQVPWRQSALTFPPAVPFGFLEKADIKLFGESGLRIRRAGSGRGVYWRVSLSASERACDFWRNLLGGRKGCTNASSKSNPPAKSS